MAAEQPAGSGLVDGWGRPVTYLRVSVTDRCNLRCVYCMPPDGVALRPREQIIRYEEIARVVAAAARLGVASVRLTGGEPLVRRDLPRLVAMLSCVPGIAEVSLTTNGLLLESMAPALKAAGLSRVNVSLDTLRPDRFARITRGGSLERVLRGLEAAEARGLAPVKINVVVMRGVNDDELRDLAALSLDHPWHVRFIELMPVHHQDCWENGFPTPVEAFLSIAEVKERLASLSFAPVVEKTGRGPAQDFRLAGAKGRIGFISPLSDHFCGQCNRLRVTADGAFRPCLLRDFEIPFLPALRRGEPVLPLLQQAIDLKPPGHGLAGPSARCMRQIGG
jgi:cyclic pyranopterin phosphate synthase